MSPTLCSPPPPTPHPSAYLHPRCCPPPHPHPFLLTLAKPLCTLIGGGLIQFAAVVDQWWITFPSFGCASLAGGGGRTWRRKQQRSGSVASERDNVRLCFPRQLSLPILLQNNNNVFSDKPFCAADGSGLWHWAALTRSDFVSAGPGGGRTQERGVCLWGLEATEAQVRAQLSQCQHHQSHAALCVASEIVLKPPRNSCQLFSALQWCLVGESDGFSALN